MLMFYQKILSAGRITFIAPKSDASLNFPEIEVQNRGNLKAGMYATAFPNENGQTQKYVNGSSHSHSNGLSSGQIL